MLHNDGGSESPGMTMKSKRCKPDYEAMISKLQARMHDRAEKFRDAALDYFTSKRAKNKAELIGEIVTECQAFRGEFDLLIKQQEEDQE